MPIDLTVPPTERELAEALDTVAPAERMVFRRLAVQRDRLQHERDRALAMVRKVREWIDVWGHGEDRWAAKTDDLLAEIDALLEHQS